MKPNLGFMEKVLLIDNYDSFTYNLAHYIESIHGFEVDVFRNNEILLDQVKDYDTIILSPGPGLPKDAGIMNDVIKEYVASKKILGVCLGMQAIGEYFGGTLININEVCHGEALPTHVINSDNLLFKGIPDTFNTARYHSWIVGKHNFPDVLILTSEDANGHIMSFRHKTYNVFGVQFHPESILTEYGKEIISNFLMI